MTIEEMALVLHQEIEIRFPDSEGNYMYSFAHCEAKRGTCMLESACGRGKTPDQARAAYVSNIRGRELVFNAMSETKRQEARVPNTLE